MTLAPNHRDLLARSAIPVEVAEAAGVYSAQKAEDLPEELRCYRDALPGLVFPWHPIEGDPVPQLRPDEPTGAKYLFQAGAQLVLNVHPSMRDRVLDAKVPLVLVEGTKQTLAAVAALGQEDYAVVGITGCYGWRQDGAPLACFARIPWKDRLVYLAFDADVTENRNVWEAAAGLTDLLRFRGATVRYVKVPGGAKSGLDDALAMVPEHDRRAAIERLLDAAKEKLGQRPAKTAGAAQASSQESNPYFDHLGLRVVDLVDAIRERGHYAAGPDGAAWSYRETGVYRKDDLIGITTDLIGNQLRLSHVRNVEAVLVDQCRREGLVIEEEPPTDGLINVPNGMLDVRKGTLLPHDPKYLSIAQLAVPWQPDAKCPKFDKWLTEMCGTQAPDLLECLGLVLCPWVPQRKTPFLYGPSRSGKGTALRVGERIVGKANCSAVTLHRLEDRFSASSLFGKLLNTAGDLSDAHIDDLSTWKMATGDDLIPGEEKYRTLFEFHNRALFVFSANVPPTVGETSRAYLNRVRPFLFPNSFEGAENPAVEAGLMAELPGILVRLVEGARRWLERGGYGVPNVLVADHFAGQSDVAALFSSQVVVPVGSGFLTGPQAYDSYKSWAQQNGRSVLGRNKFLARLENVLGPRVRQAKTGQGSSGPTGWKDVTVLPPDEWEDRGGLELARLACFSASYSREEKGGEEGESTLDTPSSRGREGSKRAIRANSTGPFCGLCGYPTDRQDDHGVWHCSSCEAERLDHFPETVEELRKRSA